MKKFLILALALILAALPALSLADQWGTSTMYVKTENGKSLNVRSAPSTDAQIVGSVAYRGTVLTDWSYAGNDGWTKVVWGSYGDAYVMTRFLVDYDPGPYTPSPEQKEADDAKAAQEKLNKELKSEVEVNPFYIVVRPSRASGWVNFRVGPSADTSRIASFDDGKELIAIGETTNWYRARDPQTNKVGYISKKYTVKSAKSYQVAATGDGKQALGKLTVNGAFELSCTLPTGYTLQVVNMRGDKIVASVLSQDATKPQMYLSIAYDETYADVERMNDLSAEDLAILEGTFTDMNEVEITYRETGFGTKLLVAREIGSDTDFVDILSIYKGYFVEFNMTPGTQAINQALTDEQIKMCIDFLTNVEFTPVQK